MVFGEALTSRYIIKGNNFNSDYELLIIYCVVLKVGVWIGDSNWRWGLLYGIVKIM